MTQIVTGSPKIKTHYQTSSPLVRLRVPATREYPHLSGFGVTQGHDYARRGAQTQATNLREKARISGEHPPYCIIQTDEDI